MAFINSEVQYLTQKETRSLGYKIDDDIMRLAFGDTKIYWEYNGTDKIWINNSKMIVKYEEHDILEFEHGTLMFNFTTNTYMPYISCRYCLKKIIPSPECLLFNDKIMKEIYNWFIVEDKTKNRPNYLTRLSSLLHTKFENFEENADDYYENYKELFIKTIINYDDIINNEEMMKKVYYWFIVQDKTKNRPEYLTKISLLLRKLFINFEENAIDFYINFKNLIKETKVIYDDIKDCNENDEYYKQPIILILRDVNYIQDNKIKIKEPNSDERFIDV